MPSMDIFLYILLSLVASLAGAAVGCVGGLALGWYLRLAITSTDHLIRRTPECTSL